MSELPPVAIVAGSGLDLMPVLDAVDGETSFANAGVGAAGVAGHAGSFLFGRSGRRAVVLQQGRRHVYEDGAPGAAARTVDALHGFGVRTVVFTNAAGGLHPGMSPGSLASATEVITWPCRGARLPERLYPDIAVPGCDFSGVYVWVHGPSYETRAEIQLLRRIGGGMVGMSTAPELFRCKELGMRAAAVSCITNNCCVPGRLTHEHVLRTAARASRRLSSVLRSMIAAGIPGEDIREGLI